MGILRVVALLGSPRKRGNTSAALDGVLKSFDELPAAVDRIWLSAHSIAGCRECFRCLDEANGPGCKVEDDMQPLYAKLLSSDVVVLATPVFTWAVAAPLKGFLERWYCLTKTQPDGSYTSMMAGKAMFGVITAAGGVNDGALMVSQGLKALAEFMRMEYLGEVSLTGLDGRGSPAHWTEIRKSAAVTAQSQLRREALSRWMEG